MNSFSKALGCALCVLALAGCAKTAPVKHFKSEITQNYTNDQVKNAIIEAGLSRDWVMTPQAPGVIQGRYTNRNHSAEVLIHYTNKGYEISYANSQNLLASEGKIHKNYNRWVNNLDHDIQVRLSSGLVK